MFYGQEIIMTSFVISSKNMTDFFLNLTYYSETEFSSLNNVEQDLILSVGIVLDMFGAKQAMIFCMHFFIFMCI